MCGTKCWGSLEGCREKELCYTGTGVAAGLGGCPSTTQLCQTHSPCPSVQVGMGKHTSSLTERSAVVKISAALSSCACMDGWLCGFQNWQCRSQRCGGKKSPGVLGSVQNVDGKTTNCSAVQSKVSMWMRLSSYPAQSCVWQCCVSSGFPVQDGMGCLCLGREEVWCWFCACGSEGLGVAEALWDVTLGYWHQDWWADCKFLWHHWGRRSLPAAGKCWLWRSAFSPAPLPSAEGTCTALCSHSSWVLGGTGGTWPCTDMVLLEMCRNPRTVMRLFVSHSSADSIFVLKNLLLLTMAFQATAFLSAYLSQITNLRRDVMCRSWSVIVLKGVSWVKAEKTEFW